MRLLIATSALLLSSILTPAQAGESAPWALLLGTGAYGGQTQVGLHYQSSNQKHGVGLTYGKTPGEIANDVDQINLKYLYSPFEFSVSKLRTNIIGIGVLASRWQSESSFIESPSQYPTSDYYSPTRWRFGLALQQSWNYKSLSVYIDWVLLDQAAIALYNNKTFIAGESPWAGGFGLRWDI